MFPDEPPQFRRRIEQATAVPELGYVDAGFEVLAGEFDGPQRSGCLMRRAIGRIAFGFRLNHGLWDSEVSGDRSDSLMQGTMGH